MQCRDFILISLFVCVKQIDFIWVSFEKKIIVNNFVVSQKSSIRSFIDPISSYIYTLWNARVMNFKFDIVRAATRAMMTLNTIYSNKWSSASFYSINICVGWLNDDESHFKQTNKKRSKLFGIDFWNGMNQNETVDVWKLWMIITENGNS